MATYYLRFSIVFLLLIPAWSSAEDFSDRWESLKATASPEQLYQLLYQVPKGGDVHNHLAGAVWPEWWYAVATDPQRNGGQRFYTRTKILNCGGCGMDWRGKNIDTVYFVTIREATWKTLAPCCQPEFTPLDELTVAQRDAWMSSVKLDKAGEGRDEFFELTWVRLNELLLDAHVIPEILVENMKHFGAENLIYLELQAPSFGMRDPDGSVVEPDEMAARYEERLAKEDALATGVEVRFLNTVLRFADDAEDRVRQTYAFLDAHRDRWVGINMAGREDNDKGYPLRFLDTYREMRRKYSGIGISIHAGEVDEPNAHVRDTLLLGATRIGHGVNLITDPDTMLLMRQGQNLVEINLVSNQLLEYTPDVTLHPFPEYLRFGIPVCLNTDDRGMWYSNMTDEYFTAVSTFDLTWDEVVQLWRYSLKHSFLQPAAKAERLALYKRNVAAFEEQFSKPDVLNGLGKAPGSVSGYAARTWGLVR